jgi:hypothetical protein
LNSGGAGAIHDELWLNTGEGQQIGEVGFCIDDSSVLVRQPILAGIHKVE